MYILSRTQNHHQIVLIHSDGLDYTEFSDMMVMFPANSPPGTTVGISVNITDDEVESTESFVLVVSSNDADAVPNPDRSSADCFIIDNDRKLYLLTPPAM